MSGNNGKDRKSHDRTETVDISVSTDMLDRLRDLAEDVEDVDDLLSAAVYREIRIQESIQSLKQDDIGPPSEGPLDSAVGAMLGITVEHIEDGAATLSMDASSRHANRGGRMQGGIITALADTCTAFAFMTTLDPGQSTTNLELKINFLRPVFEEHLTATASVVRRGRTIGLVECDVSTPEEKLVARLSTTYMVLE